MPRPVDASSFDQAAEVSKSTNISRPQRVRGRRPDELGDWAPEFFRAIMDGASIEKAARMAGVDPDMPYKRRRTDEDFKLAWKEAREIGTEFLEEEAVRRAYHGTLKPVFHKGQRCGYVREYSDTLMMFLLKARRPDVYRDGVEKGGSSGGPVTLNVSIVEEKRELNITIDERLVGAPKVDGTTDHTDELDG